MGDGPRTCTAQYGDGNYKKSGFNLTFRNGIMASVNHDRECSESVEVAVLCDPGKAGRGERVWLTDKIVPEKMNVGWDVSAYVNTNELVNVFRKAARLSPRLCKR